MPPNMKSYIEFRIRSIKCYEIQEIVISFWKVGKEVFTNVKEMEEIVDCNVNFKDLVAILEEELKLFTSLKKLVNS